MKMSKLCSPAKLYLVISAIAVIMALFYKFQMMAILTKVFFIVLWTLFLNYLCSKGYKNVSWFLVLLPYILIAITMVLSYGAVKTQKKQKK